MRQTILLALVFALLGAIAAPPALWSADSRSLYTHGKQAFDREEPDYVTALRYLAAYRELASEVLAANPTFGAAVDQAIDHSVAQLTLALRTKRELDKYGQVTEVTVTSRGKFDAAGSSGQQRTVRLPEQAIPPRPQLASRPPQSPSRPSGGAVILESTVLEAQVRPIEPVRPVPMPQQPETPEELARCREEAAVFRERLSYCERKLEEVARDAGGGGRAAAACETRLAGLDEEHAALRERFDRLVERYFALEERCEGR